MPILKKKAVTVKAPKWNTPKAEPGYGAKNCVFPKDKTAERRKFELGEIVCVRVPGKAEPVAARYNGPADSGPGYYRIREGSMGYDLPWYEVAKVPSKKSEIALESLARQSTKKTVPSDVLKIVGEYRGQARRRRTKRRRRNV